MAYFAAFLEMIDPIKNQILRPKHLQHLKRCEENGKLFACGTFSNNSGGLVIYIADSYEEAEQLANQDPYLLEKVRRLDLREWNMTQNIKL